VGDLDQGRITVVSSDANDTFRGGNRSAVGDGTRQSVDLFPAFGKKDEYLAIISLGSSLGDGFVRKVTTSGNDQYTVMDAGERGGNAKGSRIGWPPAPSSPTPPATRTVCQANRLAASRYAE